MDNAVPFWRDLLPSWLNLGRKPDRAGAARDAPAEEQPLRSELLNAQQMERYGRTLAANHRLAAKPPRDQLLSRLAANESVLLDICQRLIDAISANRRITPAGDWLLDNFHLIEEQIGMAKKHLPRPYSRELPCLAIGPSAGLPRLYDIALETIAHGDGRVDTESLTRFVAAYQSVTTLNLGELWAVPIMLRLALIENLRRVAVRVAAGRAERDLANAWADRMIDTAARDPKSLILVVADMARSSPPMTSAFVAELVRRLQGQSGVLALALTWIEQWLAEVHLTIEHLVQLESQRQASDQVSISNSIGSLRFLSAIDWREFVETSSAVEQILRRDPSRTYPAMEFATRDDYRHVIERVARRSGSPETAVADKAIELSEAAQARFGRGDLRSHVGFYLIDRGLVELEAALAMRIPAFDRLCLGARRFSRPLYLGAIGAMTIILTAGLAANARASHVAPSLFALLFALSLLASSQLALTLVNWLATLLVAPRALPRMDFSVGIPAQTRTLAVVPSMLAGAEDVAELLEALEVRFLANQDECLHFALLTDFSDAPEATIATDDVLLRSMEAGITELNRKYPYRATAAGSGAAAGGENAALEGSFFYWFHRPRRWNPREGVFMGEERKRGKLAELNAFLRGSEGGGFSQIVGMTSILSQVKYVITLDADTQLPRDAARRCVGAMAHPLNRPRFDPDRRHRLRDVVTSGYGILQPRVSVSLPSASRSRYARMHAGEAGIDPYTRMVSNVYQDVFGEGSFVGKGIYDVDAFQRALENRFPANRILSHDLLEGCYVRSGLLSDTELYESFPAHYFADVARRHRWIRGDWQLMSWLGRRVPGRGARRETNPLSILSQWKLFDNLRRSLVPIASTALLLLGWTMAPTAALWTAVVVAIVVAPSAIAFLADGLDKAADVPLEQHIAVVGRSARRYAAQAVFALAVLPYEAFYCLDAILRTLFRVLLSHRHLLEWNVSRDVDRALEARERPDLLASLRTMWVAPLIAVGAWSFLARTDPATLPIAAPILLLWLASPAIVWWVSRPIARRASRLNAGQVRFLRKLARRTWAYFETYVTDSDHWLPPDNVQVQTAQKVAHRTSPTNMGLALLANLSAFDFGYVSPGRLVSRTSDALETMEALERHRGHFYNWYNTQTLSPLEPRYVSTVDSGNLAAHLLTLRSGLASLKDAPIVNPRWLHGIEDTVSILADALGPDPSESLREFESTLRDAVDNSPEDLVDASKVIAELASRATDIAAELTGDRPEHASEDAIFWMNALLTQCADVREDLLHSAPWLSDGAQSLGHLGIPILAGIPTLGALAALDARTTFHDASRDDRTPEERALLERLVPLLREGASRARERLAIVEQLVDRIAALADPEFDFLFDKVRRQLVIGYNVGERRCDASFYDLLASEARLCTFVAIAQGKLPQESWFALGRMLTSAHGAPILLSWSGSMFEYLMPLLVMPTYGSTLLDQTYLAAVERQMEYGIQRGVPWGMSESGYNAVDVELNYQYRAFGVPGLGLKRGLGDDLVVAPYASALALMVAPEAACTNLQRLAAIGLAGTFGSFEAIDYTPTRQRRGESNAVIQSYMAHHQGMSLLSIAYVLLSRPMQRRFEADPRLKSGLLLLQERIPKVTQVYPGLAEVSSLRATGGAVELPVRVVATPDTAFPEVQLLSNGNYHVMVTNAGGGYSHWRDLAVTRWREDGTSDNWGSFCYLRDTASSEYWSCAHQPALKRGDVYEAIFSEGRAEFRRSDSDLDTHTEIAVSPEDDVEVRRLRVTNRARGPRTVEATSYLEIVLAPPAADALHPAFSNLFVQTETVPERHAILCTRRPRSLEERSPWMFHLMAVHGATAGEASFETDRMRFIGRCGSVEAPAAMMRSAPLSNTTGPVLDPVAAIRRNVTIPAGETVTIDVVTGVMESREMLLDLVDKYQDRVLADRAFELTWTHSLVVLRQLNANETDSQLYARLAGLVIYANPSLRASASVLMRNRRGQSGLWGYAISGDLPIVLLQIASAENLELVRQLVQAHAYWRLKGLAVDLVIWNEGYDGYRQQLHEQIIGLIASGVEAHVLDRPGGIFVRHAEQISPEDRILFESVARVILSDSRGSLADQISARASTLGRIPLLAPTRTHRPESADDAIATPEGLIFFNGSGGFTPDGREYVMVLDNERPTPAPWTNILANPGFGTIVLENGLGNTWSENAYLFRLTPWHNDPVGAPSGEALYIRDEQTGHFWSPTSFPCAGAGAYVTRHGFGYTVFEHLENGIHSELTVFVAIDAAVKFFSLKLTNRSDRARHLSATGYIEWVLSDLRPKSAMHITTEFQSADSAMYAQNRFNHEFPGRVAFFDVDDVARTTTGDRREFVGRNRTLRDPAAMHRARLSGSVGPALDPCAAMQVSLELASGEDRVIVFRLGAAGSLDSARDLARRFRGTAVARETLDDAVRYWQDLLGAVQVATPDPALDVLANGWLVYQTMACRLWARCAYYQPGGAFGFRDQLQDAMALIHANPDLLRKQIALCASRQFVEGDVQHWWHPPSGRGVRTHCADDYLWLPLAASRYALTTGDLQIFDEDARFLDGRPLNPEDDSYYDLPQRSDASASIYDHCVKAIDYGLKFGVHGLPLIGSGDWNDGMNLVGRNGKGESVWLAFFLAYVLAEFAKVARLRDDEAFAVRCEDESQKLRGRIELNTWDGAWYRRAYFDDGTPLGSKDNPECQIDSVAQSWSVLSGAAPPERAREAMQSVVSRLVRRDLSLIQLLDPPFDKSDLDPGYIRGYVPGVRENGGQYTHAAIWAAIAFSMLEDESEAHALFAMINPINHARTADELSRYKVEPYVVAADVYAFAPHSGRGGWTWYTGSAGWMYRLVVESLLGLTLEAGRLRLAPRLPRGWTDFQVRYRFRRAHYDIFVRQETREKSRHQHAATVIVDGVLQTENVVVLVDDDRRFRVDVHVPAIESHGPRAGALLPAVLD
jgi:cellobiose phosphorylase